MKKVLIGIFLVIDIVLLVVIIFPLIKPSENSDESEKRVDEAKNAVKEEIVIEDGPEGYLDTAGIEGIVDISEADGSMTDNGEADGSEKDINNPNLEEMTAPTLADFMWYYDGVYYNGVPGNAEVVSEKDKLSGAWKAFFWFGHDVSGSYDAMEFANVLLTPEDNTVEISAKMCLLYFPESEVVDESKDPIHTFSGTWDENGIKATGAGNINITSFYEMPGGHQYAIGTFDAPDGTPTVIALTRP